MNKLLIVFTKPEFYNPRTFPPAKDEKFFKRSLKFCLLNENKEYRLLNYNSGTINYLRMPDQSGILLVSDIDVIYNSDNLDKIINALNDVVNFKTHDVFVWYHDRTKRIISGRVNLIWNEKKFKYNTSEHLRTENIVYNYIADFYQGKIDLDTIIIKCFDSGAELLLKKELKEVFSMIDEKMHKSPEMKEKLRQIEDLEKKVLK